MNEFKAYASRALNRLASDGPDRKRWARHGSTRWLWKDEDVRHALQYISDEQGEAMALFLARSGDERLIPSRDRKGADSFVASKLFSEEQRQGLALLVAYVLKSMPYILVLP